MIGPIVGRILMRVVFGPLGRWRRRRATLRALMRLDDRLLKDIGIARSEIPGRADDAVERIADRPR